MKHVAFDAPLSGMAWLSRPTRTQPVRGAHTLGLVGGTALHVAVLLAMLFQWQASPDRVRSMDDPITVFMAQAASPPAPVRDVSPGPQTTEAQETKADKRPRLKQAHRVDAAVPDPEMFAAPRVAPTTPSSASSPSQTTAPPSLPAPPAPRLASNARDSWQGRLLAHLEKHRRYPANARSGRIQGTAYVAFRMNRSGAVISASIQRSSGSSILDQAALATVRRAQPLPAIPADMPDEVDLAVPVEFYLSR